MLDAGQWYCVNDDSIVVIPAKAGIQILVILSEAKDLALGDEYYVAAKGIQIFVILSEAKDLALGDKNNVAAKRRKKIVKLLLPSNKHSRNRPKIRDKRPD